MKTALIIPAYKPGKEMLELLERFRGSEEFVPVVVDDGSGADFRHIFDAVPDFATLLRHEVNRGKGAALKTAINHVLKNMPECALALTADADGQHRMVKNWFEWRRDAREYPRIHPSQKPIAVLKRLIEIFTDPGDVVIDPCAGSGSTLRAARALGRPSYGFEVSREFYNKATEQMLGKEEPT
jgi:glycosyltransferase involved in cell wall biosynthesis